MGRDESTNSTLPESTDTSVEVSDRSRLGLYLREIGTSVGAVVLVGALLFAVSGVWPPLVAIESGSMEPHVQVGDLVFVMDEERFAAPEARHGVVTARTGAETGHTVLGNPGDVIVFAPDGDESRTPIIHRAMFWVEDGEQWYDRANPDYVGNADSCAELEGCPADHAAFVTKGDANPSYDTVLGISDVVRPDWVVGTAEARIPFLGRIRLGAAGVTGAPGSATGLASASVSSSPTGNASVSSGNATTAGT
jgi:signal peptidase